MQNTNRSAHYSPGRWRMLHRYAINVSNRFHEVWIRFAAKIVRFIRLQRVHYNIIGWYVLVRTCLRLHTHTHTHTFIVHVLSYQNLLVTCDSCDDNTTQMLRVSKHVCVINNSHTHTHTHARTATVQCTLAEEHERDSALRWEYVYVSTKRNGIQESAHCERMESNESVAYALLYIVCPSLQPTTSSRSTHKSTFIRSPSVEY